MRGDEADHLPALRRPGWSGDGHGRAFRRRAGRCAHSAAGPPRPARDLLASTIDAYLVLIEDDTNLYRFLSVNEPGRRDLVAGLIAEAVAEVLERYLDNAGQDTAGAKPWAYGLVGMVHFTGDWWARNGTPSRSVLVDQLTSLLWSGFDGLGLANTSTPKERR